MTLPPVLSGSGVAGLAFLDRSRARLDATLAAAPAQARDEAYLRDRIGKIDTAADLVADRRLLRIVLEAHGLEADVNNRFFLQKLMEGGTLRPEALANRLADKRYAKLAATFGFGDVSPPRNKISDFPGRLAAQWRERRLEAAVGAQDNALRLALNARRELAELAARPMGDAAKWFTIMGNPPLRQVVAQALGLPASSAQLNVDRQLDLFRTGMERLTGRSDVAQFTDPAARDALVRRHLLRTQVDAGLPPGTPALTLITQGVFRRL